MSSVLGKIYRSFTRKPTEQPSDAGEAETGIQDSRSPTHSRPPTTSTVDLTDDANNSPPPPSTNKRRVLAPAPALSRRSETRPVNRKALNEVDLQRLVPGKYPYVEQVATSSLERGRTDKRFRSPEDATPLDWRRKTHGVVEGSMVKPGAGLSFRPFGHHNVPKTYSNKGRTPVRSNNTSYHNYIEDSSGLPPSPYESSPKRRKTAHVQHDEAIDLEQEDNHSERRSRSSPCIVWSSPSRGSQLHLHSSRRSVGSEHSATARSGRLPNSEFEDAHKIVHFRPKATRAPGRSQNGQAANPIDLVDDTSYEKPSTAKRLQFDSFEQGISQESRIFAPFFEESNRPGIKLSTKPSRGEPEQSRGKPQSDNLRENFKRTTEPYDEIVDSADELAPQRTKPEQQKRSAKRALPASAASSPHIKGLPSQGWSLQCVKTQSYEAQGPGLALKRGTQDKSWRIVTQDDAGRFVDMHKFSLGNVNRAEADNIARIRLQGPRQANGDEYQLLLQFKSGDEFRLFKDTCARDGTCTGKIADRTEQYMVTLFNKPIELARNAATAHEPEPSQSLHTTGEHQTGRSSPPHLIDRLLQKRATAEMDSNSQPLTNGRTETLRASTRPKRTTRATTSVVKPDEPAKPGYSVTNGLGSRWRRQVTYGSGRRRSVVDFEDLFKLDEEQCLNDSLIEFYMIYLFDQYKVDAERVYFFNTHFFTTLTRKVAGQKGAINYAGVARWTAKEDLFHYDYIVVPINQEFHWYLAIICNVRNIARKPVIEDVNDVSTPPPNDSDLLPLDHLADPNVRNPVATIPSANTEATKHIATSNDDQDSILFDEESLLDTVDAEATRPASSQTMPAESDSSAVGAAGMQKLSLTDSPTVGILPQHNPSPVTSKKPKRKTGPPVKKWDPDEPCIIILDSLGGGAKSGAVRALKDYLHEEGKEKRGMEADIRQNAMYAKSSQIPMQDNFSDCGVYLLGYTQKFFENPDAFKNSLLKAEMQADTDWPDMKIPEIRAAMRNTLRGLYAKQNEERKTAQNEKKCKKPVSGTQTPQPDTALGMTQPPPLRAEATTEQVAIVDPTPLGSNAPVKKLTTETSSAEAREPKLDGQAAERIRLGSPFDPHPKAQAPKPFSHNRKPPTKMDGSPEKTQGQMSRSTQSQQRESLGSTTGKRAPSPQVVIMNKSPPSALPDAFKRSHASKDDASDVLTGSKKQKTDHVGEVTASRPAILQEVRLESLSNAGAHNTLGETDVRSPEYPKRAHNGQPTTSPSTTPKRHREERDFDDDDDDDRPGTEVRPPDRQHQLPLGWKKLTGREFSKGSPSLNSSAVSKSARSSVRAHPVEPQKNTAKLATVRRIPQDTRGSSGDPIEIEDSQPSPKQKPTWKPDSSPSQESFIVESPKDLSKQALETIPGPFRYRAETEQRTLQTLYRRSVPLQEEGFVGDQLDSHVQTAQGDEDCQEQALTDEEKSFQGFSPEPPERSVLVEVDSEDEAVAETPDYRTRSPASQTLPI
ncbi:hypothetical protein CC80DRAFT_499866 [Byssothecium circinans]|uniref:Ubiquitin-like protease family profile domain-containing protein n=1 Tax=Byssothecium circinans TaxID=147558 RepID=A0A6A5UN40_9PLEO|nr:hypothetical protein CC80DRAFT_499866 [Byssothecium circinans]